MRKLFLIIFSLIYSSVLLANDKTYWRGGWGVGGDMKKGLAKAKELGFNALIQKGYNLKKLDALCKEANKEDIEIYYWLDIICGDTDLSQQMNKEETEKARKISQDKDPSKHGYQHGGEPINVQTDVYTRKLLCFHREATVKLMQDKIVKAFKACPDLTGIAFDYFGYMNYRCCRCPHSMKLFEEYFKKQPKGTDREKALERFSLNTLVEFTNNLAAFVRKTKPGSKIVIHIYPTFLPDPIYGNRLNVDYCCQTVAWFFKPYWNLKKVKKYTELVINQDKKYNKKSKGIPFVGIFQGLPGKSKPTEVFQNELRTIRACGTMSFSICPFDILIKKPELAKVFLKEMGK